MLISILNRATGSALALAGTLGFVWWLLAIAGGKEGYDAFQACATSWYGYVVKIGLTWAFFQHLCAGIRHFVMDMGAGFELKSNRTSAYVAMGVAALLTAALWGYLFYVKG